MRSETDLHVHASLHLRVAALLCKPTTACSISGIGLFVCAAWFTDLVYALLGSSSRTPGHGLFLRTPPTCCARIHREDARRPQRTSLGGRNANLTEYRVGLGRLDRHRGNEPSAPRQPPGLRGGKRGSIYEIPFHHQTNHDPNAHTSATQTARWPWGAVYPSYRYTDCLVTERWLATHHEC
ncbi:hypothetical protein BJX62DRAFT_217337 [Aspergillus germanicus]